jgi:hypothetical protein
MAEEKRSRQRKYHSEYFYRYADMRAIIPASFIALIWSIIIALYIPSKAITEIIVEQAQTAVKFPILTGWIVDILFRTVIFIFDFILVFLIFYFVFWVIWREQDKRVMLQLKKKRQI